MTHRIRARSLVPLMLVAAAGAVPVAAATYVGLFATEQLAQQHCPRDAVVWLDRRTGHYFVKGQGWGVTAPTGAFVCRGEATNAGAVQGAKRPQG